MENMEMKKILVTGSSGFIGSNLMEVLKNPIPYDLAIGRDIFDTHLLIGKMKECEMVIHLAAKTIVEEAYENPLETLWTNIMGTISILEVARCLPQIKAIFVASSDKAYGKCEGIYTEDHPLKGDHPYDVSKSSADLIAQMYWRTYGLPVVIGRFANTYGEKDSHFNRIVPGIMKAIINNETLELRSDGSYTRDYLYVKDTISGILTLMENIKITKGEAFNLSSDDHYSVIGLIEAIEKILGVKVSYKVLNNAKNEIPAQTLSCEKIKKMTGWEAKYSLKKAIPETFAWYERKIHSRLG